MSGKRKEEIFCLKLKLFTYFVIQSALKTLHIEEEMAACIHCNRLMVMQVAEYSLFTYCR